MSHFKTNLTRALGALVFVLGAAAATPAVASAASAGSAVSTPTLAQCENYAGTLHLAVSNANPKAGDTVTLTGTGYPPNASIPITANGTAVGTATTNGSGSFTFPWTVPTTATANEVFTFNGNCATIEMHTAVTVVSGVTIGTTIPGGTQPLPSTGSSNTMPLLGTGIGLVTLGGLILLAMRKRDQRAGHAA